MIINFPLFLHGKREFVQGNIEYILKKISLYFNIKKITIIHSKSRKYNGWKRCGQSLYRIKSFTKRKNINLTPESIVCEIIALKNHTKNESTIFNKSSIIRYINLYRDYTFVEIIIKIMNKIKLLNK